MIVIEEQLLQSFTNNKSTTAKPITLLTPSEDSLFSDISRYGIQPDLQPLVIDCLLSSRDMENDLVDILGFEQFSLIGALIKHRKQLIASIIPQQF